MGSEMCIRDRNSANGPTGYRLRIFHRHQIPSSCCTCSPTPHSLRLSMERTEEDQAACKEACVFCFECLIESEGGMVIIDEGRVMSCVCEMVVLEWLCVEGVVIVEGIAMKCR